MGFPILLAGMFFATLNFNPKVLYAPSDFKSDENFLNTLIGTKSVYMSLDEIKTGLLEGVRTQILQVVEQTKTVGEAEGARLSQTLNRQLQRIESRIEQVRQTAEAIVSHASAATYLQADPQTRILQFLGTNKESRHSLADIARHVGIGLEATMHELHHLIERGLVVEYPAAPSLWDESYSIVHPQPLQDTSRA
jgi:hypothetical protein